MNLGGLVKLSLSYNPQTFKWRHVQFLNNNIQYTAMKDVFCLQMTV